jgi:chromosomal replication initiation ATPase DnaA
MDFPKKLIEEEFFHTFNALCEPEYPAVPCCRDSPPRPSDPFNRAA